ncbi:hypothetical protein FEM08_03030 [Flavobacterium gilvum]|nr:hypothetical protein FEM08_03030 [Flavobacterium gilvum]
MQIYIIYFKKQDKKFLNLLATAFFMLNKYFKLRYIILLLNRFQNFGYSIVK